ncbi:hypothetical protein FRC00_003164 [Tulasnella sp. 408]|nr:hypothetical protein FRC00_003164 [Tulasnella sp. 408]
MKFQFATLFFSAILLAIPALASKGDTGIAFHECLESCVVFVCDVDTNHELPYSLKLMQWDCPDNCKYECMMMDVDRDLEAIASGSEDVEIKQYYGKWPFHRFVGIQEPASVVFSLMNLWAHIRGGKYLLGRMRSDHPMYKYYFWYIIIGANAWVWSTVFHMRDKPATEKLDYFSAALTILYSLYVAVVRLFGLYQPPRLHLQQPASYSARRPSWLPPQHILHQLWGALCVLLYLAHVIYLSVIPRFDYSYNVIANLIVGVLHNLLWLSYSFSFFPFRRFEFKPQSYIPPYAWKPAALAIGMTLATSLELWDFPPWWFVIDAHSLWHLATVPLTWWWYRFIAEDAADSGWASGRIPMGKGMLD